ncbi:MAG: aspartate kinase [Thermoplasmatales archaeon]|nr:aspartate kinase [Thermoplasmatales archaeon]
MTRVMKFGGSSVGSPEALKRAAGIVVGTEGPRAVVVSAVAGITNFLIGVLEGEFESMDLVYKKFAERHMDVARQAFGKEQLSDFMEDFGPRLEAFKALLKDEDARKDPYFVDNLMSQGERFSSLLLAHAIRAAGADAVALTSEEAGIVAHGNSQAATVDFAKTSINVNLNVKPLMADGSVPVITGFYGVGPKGQPITFGRGGSDYAATALGNALDADIVEIWTDVDGFMTSDPKVVPGAKVIDEMNYSEAAELAYFGAKVLHPRSVEPARTKHIPIYIKNSHRPEAAGTRVHNLGRPNDDLLKAVAMKVDLSIITVNSAEIACKPRMVARIIDAIAESDVCVYAISTSLSTIAFLIHNLDVKETLRNLNRVDSEIVEHINVKSNVALVCAVGDSLLASQGFSGYVFGAVKDAGANVEMISEGASDVSLNFVVPTDSVLDVVRTLHDRFITGAGK